MAEFNKLKLRILFLITLYESVEGSCYYYFHGYNYVSVCNYYNPYPVIFGASYGAVIGLGILVSLIVWWCCVQRRNRELGLGEGYHGTVIVTTTPTTNNPSAFLSGNQQIQHTTMAVPQGIMMGPTQYGSPQGQVSTSVGFPSTAMGAGVNSAGTVQSENK